MNDLARLERLIADVAAEAAGPSRPVDVAAITRAATIQPPKWRFQPMFSAIKFVVAAAIVALFGGFLLAGVLTQEPSEEQVPAAVTDSPAPTTTSDLLPDVDLVAEEVEPDVWRVVSDGVRDVSRPVVGEAIDSSVYQSNVVAGLDGSVWVFGPDEFYQLGDGLAFPASVETPNRLGRKAMATPDGVLWAIHEDTSSLASFADGTWTVEKADVMAFDVQPDGTVWAVTTDWTLHRREAGGWVVAADMPALDERARDLWVSPVIHEFFAQSYGQPNAEVEVLLLTDGGVGSVGGSDLSVGFPELAGGGGFGPAGALEIRLGSLVDMDVHGDYWIYQDAPVPLAGQGLADSGASSVTVPYLVHVTGGPTTVYTEEEGVPLVGSGAYGWPELRAAPDGSVWLTLEPEDPENEICEGIARFDGSTLVRHLAGMCIYAFDIAPDGSVWVRASGQPTATGAGQIDTYVITPEPGGDDE